MSEKEQSVFPTLFRSLVRAGAKTEEDTRRRADLRSLDETTRQVVAQLADERLLVTTREPEVETSAADKQEGDESTAGESETPGVGVNQSKTETVEVAHEALLRQWDRLKQWVDTDRQFLQWRSRLAPMIEQHRRNPQPSLLLREGYLREAGQFYPSRKGELDLQEQSFVHASFEYERELDRERRRQDADNLVQRLRVARIGDIREIIDRLKANCSYAEKAIGEGFGSVLPGSSEFANLVLALMSLSGRFRDETVDVVADAKPEELPVIIDHLAFVESIDTEAFWKIAENHQEASGRRVNSAAVLARFASEESDRWRPIAPVVTDGLLTSVLNNPSHYQPFTQTLRPARKYFCDDLVKVAQDGSAAETKRKLAVDILLDYAADESSLLADMLFAAETNQFEPVLERLRAHGEQAAELCRLERERTSKSIAEAASEFKEGTPSINEENQERLAKRQVNAAVALLRLGATDLAWPAFLHSADPRARSYLIHRVAALDVDPSVFMPMLDDQEADVSTRRALLLCLGEYDESQLPEQEREKLIPELLRLHRSPDAGLHATAEWLLRRWLGSGDQVSMLEDTERWEREFNPRLVNRDHPVT